MKRTWKAMTALTCALTMVVQPLSSTLGLSLNPVIAPIETVQGATDARMTMNLNPGWSFKQATLTGAEAKDYATTGWATVNLPHTWNNMDGQDGGNNYAKGDGWYRKTVNVPATYAGKQLFLQFEGANTETTLYVNGTLVPFVDASGTYNEHKGGYTTFRYDLTGKLEVGKDNLIAVKVNNQIKGTVAPISGDFTFFGGIYRDVDLIATNPVHIDLENYGSKGFFITPKKQSDTAWNVDIKTNLVNDTDATKTVTVKTTVREPEKIDYISGIAPENTPFDEATMIGDTELATKTSSTLTIPANGSLEYTDVLAATNPRLWNGMTDPFQYQVDVEVLEGTTVVDNLMQFVGFRTFEVTKEGGFFLNGKAYSLRGVSRHQDRENMGNAITTKEHDEDFSLIYEIGSNSIRFAHYPQASYMYDLCDKYGIVNWAEIPFVDFIGGTGAYATPDATRAEFFRTTKSQLIELIRQNYNRPGICFWGLQNEVRGNLNSVMQPFIAELNTLAKKEDATRLTTQATNDGTAKNWASDLIAVNLYPGWYGGNISQIGGNMDGWKNSSTRPVGISEYGAGGNHLQHEDNPAQPTPTGEWHPEEYQTKSHESQQQQISTRNYLWCSYVWNMFDFAADQRSEGDNHGMNDKGMITHDRKIKKDSFFLYKASWNKDRNFFVHINERRNNPRVANTVTVKLYSNCDTVELKVDGVSVGTLNQADMTQYGVFTFNDVALKDGSTVVTATGTKAGKTYTDTLTWDRAKSTNTTLVSTTLGVDNTSKTITLTKNILVTELAQNLTSEFGATFKAFNAAGTTEQTTGSLLPGMIVRVTAEDGTTTADYTVAEANISFGKTVTASSVQDNNDGKFPANLAVDGKTDTRWAADPKGGSTTFPQTLDIDLGSSYELSKINLNWFKPNATRSYTYKVYVSDTANTFGTTPAIDKSSNTTGGITTDVFTKTSGRYVRIEVTGNNNAGGYAVASLYEVEVFGWAFGTTEYTIDKAKNMIYVTAEAGKVIQTSDFLTNLNLKGNYTATLNSGSYFIVDGDELTITDKNQGKTVFTICINPDTCDNLHGFTDLAKTATITVSGTETTTDGVVQQASFMTDGNLETRWAAPKRTPAGTPTDGAYPEWVEFDLGANYNQYTLAQIELYFYMYGQDNRAYQYEILGRNSTTEEYRSLVDKKANTDKSGHFTASLPANTSLRYIKVNVTGCDLYTAGSKWAVASICELAIKGVKKDEPVVPEVNKTALKTAIDNAKTYKAADYTASTFASLTTAISNAETVYASTTATQAEVDAKKTAIENAITALVRATITPVAVTGVTVAPGTVTIKVGNTSTLSATVAPSNADNKALTWTSSDASVATVNANGLVTAVAKGTATIKATSNSNNTIFGSCVVTVEEEVVVEPSTEREALKAAIDSAKAYEASKYTADSFKKLTEQIAIAEALYADSEAGDFALESAIKDLQDAIGQLADYVAPPIEVKNGWYDENDTKRYYENNQPKANTWVKDHNGVWFYVGTDGFMKTGWLKDGGAWYFLQTDGKMKTGWLKDGGAWYFLQGSGKMKTGWQKDGGAWYFLQSSGKMKTGWQKDGGAWYFLQSSGKMKTGWLKDGASWYYLQSSGKMKTGWLKDGGAWYYLQSSGKMKTGWLQDGGAWYYLQSSGKMKTGWLQLGTAWYYLTASGKMATGWTSDGNKTYYFNTSSGIWSGGVR